MTENWGDAEQARVIQFEIQPDSVSVQLEEPGASLSPIAFLLKCVLYETEKVLSIFQVMSLLKRLCEREFSSEETDIIKGDLRIYSYLSIPEDKSQKLFGAGHGLGRVMLFRWETLFAILARVAPRFCEPPETGADTIVAQD